MQNLLQPGHPRPDPLPHLRRETPEVPQDLRREEKAMDIQPATTEK